MAVELDDFRQVLRRWASGVTVVTAKDGEHVHGMTVSAFSSVSAEPPLVLVCANRSSTTHGVIEKGGVFTVNILADHQAEVSNVFASSNNEESRFDSVPWRSGETGAPVLEEALASLECKVVNAYQEGSHTIYVGRVEAVHTRDADPLLYFQGSYRSLRCKDA